MFHDKIEVQKDLLGFDFTVVILIFNNIVQIIQELFVTNLTVYFYEYFKDL